MNSKESTGLLLLTSKAKGRAKAVEDRFASFEESLLWRLVCQHWWKLRHLRNILAGDEPLKNEI
jgi:hypothetical protein